MFMLSNRELGQQSSLAKYESDSWHNLVGITLYASNVFKPSLVSARLDYFYGYSAVLSS